MLGSIHPDVEDAKHADRVVLDAVQDCMLTHDEAANVGGEIVSHSTKLGIGAQRLKRPIQRLPVDVRWRLPHCSRVYSRMPRRSFFVLSAKAIRSLRADIGMRLRALPEQLVGFPADLLHKVRRPFHELTAVDLFVGLGERGAQPSQAVLLIEQAQGLAYDRVGVAVQSGLDFLLNESG